MVGIFDEMPLSAYLFRLVLNPIACGVQGRNPGGSFGEAMTPVIAVI